MWATWFLRCPHLARQCFSCVQVWYRLADYPHPCGVGNKLVHSKLKYIHINLGAIQDHESLVNNNYGEQNFKLNRILDRAKIDNYCRIKVLKNYV